MPIDLLAGGSSLTAVLTPSATAIQQATFQPGSLNQQVKGDNWPLARGIGVKGVTIFDQAASGGSVVEWDQLFRIWDSFNTFVPTLGTVHDKNVFTGPAAKHVMEFVGNGYRYCDWARAQLIASDGDVTLTLYVFLPFTAENFIQPEAFWPWVGWLKDMTVQTNLALSTAIAAVSTGAVVKTSMTISAWIEAYVLPQPIRFLISQWNRYLTNAASGNTSVLLQNVGQPNGLNGAVPGCRINAIFELMNVLGLGGASTGDLFTSFQSNELGQDITYNPDAFVSAYKSLTGHAGPINGFGATPGADGAGNPNTMASTPNGSLNNVAIAYMPWRFPSKNQRIENCVKWAGGNITLTRNFSTVPTTGTHTIYTNEIRELDGAKWRELSALANLGNVPAAVLTDRPLRRGQAEGQAGVFQTRRG
jgi:hypothetical protein